MSIHDVAPATWPACLRLLDAVREVADIPLTLLVVPCYHGSAARDRAYESMLGHELARGHELALHGYRHLDCGPPALGLAPRWQRGVYARGEAEFAALSERDSGRLLSLGLAWFARRDWPVHGFVAPAWLLGEGAWQAIRLAPLHYTTTWSHFHWLAPAGRIWSPSLVYAARNRSGRVLSRALASTQAIAMARMPLVRLGLHPADAAHPPLLRHAQRLIASLLEQRTALTKASFAALNRSRP